MKTLERFLRSNIDREAVGLLAGDTAGGYFCTPKGARVFGWAGVDGIHYCTVRGYGDTVFAVDPSAAHGENVCVLAASFEDFLRLLVTVGDAMLLIDACRFSKERFLEIVDKTVISIEVKTVLNQIKMEFGVEPMEDAYDYIRAVGERVDLSRLRFSKEYNEAEEEIPPTAAEWKVMYDSNFCVSKKGNGRSGDEIQVNKCFDFCGERWEIFSVYLFGKGLVVDFGFSVDSARVADYIALCGDGRQTGEEWERLQEQNPLDLRVGGVRVLANGRELESRSGIHAGSWIPCLPEGEENAPELESAMQHYNCDRSRGYTFCRVAFGWATARRPKLRELTFTVEPATVTHTVRLGALGVGQRAAITDPVTGTAHLLTVEDMTQERFSKPKFGDRVLPDCYWRMTYTLTPDKRGADFSVSDASPADEPRRVGKGASADFSDPSCAIIGGADGPTAILFGARGTEASCHAACSSFRFSHVESSEIVWQARFRYPAGKAVTVGVDVD